MKLLRIWLVVLLTVVLPLRSAIAATMLCPPAAATSGELSTVADSANHDGMEHLDGVHDHGQHEQGKGSHDKCSFCSSSCSSPLMPSTSTGLCEPAALASQAFPDFSAPAPIFLSDGQERPPRTL